MNACHDILARIAGPVVCLPMLYREDSSLDYVTGSICNGVTYVTGSDCKIRFC